MEIPRDSWKKARLVKFVIKVGRLTAQGAWGVGRACLILQAKHVPKGEWMDFVAENFGEGSYPTISRYMTLAELVSEEHLGDKTLTETYFSLGMARRRKAHEPPVVVGEKLPPADGEPTDNGAGPGPEEEPQRREPVKRIISIEVGSNLKASMDAVPTLVANLIESIEWLASQHKHKRAVLWRKMDHAALRERLASLKEKLAWLEADLPKSKPKKSAG